MDKAVKLLAISIFRNLHVITKILYYENLELYGIVVVHSIFHYPSLHLGHARFMDQVIAEIWCHKVAH